MRSGDPVPETLARARASPLTLFGAPPPKQFPGTTNCNCQLPPNCSCSSWIGSDDSHPAPAMKPASASQSFSSNSKHLETPSARTPRYTPLASPPSWRVHRSPPPRPENEKGEVGLLPGFLAVSRSSPRLGSPLFPPFPPDSPSSPHLSLSLPPRASPPDLPPPPPPSAPC